MVKRFFFLFVLWSFEAWAHQLPIEHRLLFQVNRNKCMGLMLYEIPPGQPSDLLKLYFDLNRSGTLEAREREALALKLGKDATSGVHIFRNKQRLPLTALDWEIDASGKTILLILKLTFEPCGPGHFEITVSEKNHAPLKVEVEVVKPLNIALQPKQTHSLEAWGPIPIPPKGRWVFDIVKSAKSNE